MVDEPFKEWMHAEQRCAVHGYGGCSTPFSLHHVRFCGSGRNDRRALGLCWEMHLHDYGKYSIERLGKPKWEAHHGISIEAEITRYNEDYVLVEKPLALHAPQTIEGTFGGAQIVSATRAAALP